MRLRVLVSIQIIGFILTIQNEASSDDGLVNKSTVTDEAADGPKDYSFAPTESRVQDLVGFFEQMRQASENPFYYKNKDTPITLSEAASKLHHLSYKLPLQVKCNKYVKLISKPNIRSFGTVNELMKEAKDFDDVEQLEANLVSRLTNERRFNAMGRIQTILQSLESEKTLGHSDYEPAVQKDLLDCINYYVYRHQRATSSIVSHVRESIDKLPKLETSRSEILYRKFKQIMSNMEALESLDSRQFNNTAWLNELAKVHKLVQENNYEIPEIIQSSLTHSDRLKRLNLIGEAPKRSEFLMQKIEFIEASSENRSELNSNDEYYVALEELDDLYTCYKDILPHRVGSFVQDLERRQLLENRLHLHDELSSSSSSSKSRLQSNNQPLDDNEASNATTTQQVSTITDNSTSKTITSNTAINIKHSSYLIRPANRKRRLRKTSKSKKRVRVKDHDIKQDDLNSNTTFGFHCGNSLDGLLSAMQTINIKQIRIDQATSLADEMVLFKSNCFGDQMEADRGGFERRGNWPIVSLTEKLSRWCRSKLKDPSISPGDQASMFEVLGILQKIMSHDKDTGRMRS